MSHPGAVGPLPFETTHDAADPRKLVDRVPGLIEQDVMRSGWPEGEMLGSEADSIEPYGVSRAILPKPFEFSKAGNAALGLFVDVLVRLTRSRANQRVPDR